jgi:hypothetical protein
MTLPYGLLLAKFAEFVQPQHYIDHSLATLATSTSSAFSAFNLSITFTSDPFVRSMWSVRSHSQSGALMRLPRSRTRSPESPRRIIRSGQRALFTQFSLLSSYILSNRVIRDSPPTFCGNFVSAKLSEILQNLK